MPATMRVAMVQNLPQADPYSHQKGIFQAREAVVMQQQDRGVMDVTADDVLIGSQFARAATRRLRADRLPVRRTRHRLVPAVA